MTMEEAMLKLGEELMKAEDVLPLPEAVRPGGLSNLRKEPNKAGDGFNLIWDWKIYGTNEKDDKGRAVDGRVLTDWTALPKDGDENEHWSSGQTAMEAKLNSIKKILVSLGIKLTPKLAAGVLRCDQETVKQLVGLKLRIHSKPDVDKNGNPVNRILGYQPK